MVDYGDEDNRVYANKDLGVITIGGDVYALVNYVEVWWQFAIDEMDVLGSDVPLQGARGMRGQVLIRRVYSTDKDLLSIQAKSGGIVPESTITGAYTDTQGSPTTKTWTIKARLGRIRHQFTGPGFIIAEISGPLTAVPSVV